MPIFYTLLIEGRLDSHWSEWFEGMTVTHLETGNTLLSGPLVDQAALYGLLNRIRDLNLNLIYLEKISDNKGITP